MQKVVRLSRAEKTFEIGGWLFQETTTQDFDLRRHILKVIITCRDFPVDREVLRSQEKVIQ